MFEDIIVKRELQNDDNLSSCKIAVLLHTDKALETFMSEYDSCMNYADISIGEWFICSYNQIFEKPILESIALLDEFIEDTTSSLLSLEKELSWAINIKHTT